MKIMYIFAMSSVILFASDASLSMYIKLAPIAVNADKVLFSTQKYESTVGAVRPCAKTDFGWLVVSAAGVWDERDAYSYDCKKENNERYRQYLQGKITVKTPDKALGELMKKYEFYKSSVLESEPYVYEIKSKQSCFKGECLEQTTKQKTLGKLSSVGLHSPIRSSFYYKGVALFHNVKEDYTPSYPEPAIRKQSAKGVSFDIERKGQEYNASYIDGLVLFDHWRFKIDVQIDLPDVRKQIEHCESKKSKHKIFKLKNAQWDICQANKKSKIITIEYKEKETKHKRYTEYKELYVVNHGKLVYAFEQQSDSRKGHQWIWNCQFAIIDEIQAEVLTSLGHGKTEDDNWNANEIIEMYKKRMHQLKDK